MNASVLLTILFSLINYVALTCTHTIRLTDTFGDGWNGGTVKVRVNGVDVLTNVGSTFTTGSGPIDLTFNANTGDNISVIETAAGSFPTEMRVTILDGGGASLLAAFDPTTGAGTSCVGNCPPPMSITAATVVQSSAASTIRCGSNQKIVCLQITTTGVTSPKTVTQIQTNFAGTATVSALSNADIYYTGTSATFSATTLFGSNGAPSATTYNINGSQVLASGINYFWLVYDLNNTGTVGTTIDAVITQFTASATNYNSGSAPNISVTNPAGTSSLSICTAPGGIFTGLETWVKSDAGIVNQAPGGTAVLASGSPSINSVSTSYNYNPYIDFTAPAGSYVPNGADANRQFLKLSGYDGIAGLDYRTLFWTGNLTDLTRAYTHLATVDDVTHSAPSSTLHGTISGANAAVNDAAYDVNDFGSSAAAGTWKSSGTTLPSLALHTTKKQIISALSSAGGGTTLNRFFGGQRDHSSNGFMGSPRDWNGPAAELIGFTTKLTATERQKVHSYLAIKYGITLAENYLSTSAGTIFTTAAPYHIDIIGIGRDDVEGLTQKQSHQDDDSVRIYLNTIQASNLANTGSFSADISYVVQGSNNAKLCSTTASNAEIPTGLTSCAIVSRIAREWKVTRTNMAQSYNMDVKLNACANPGSVNVAHLRFLVDDDGNFANGGTQCYYNGDGTGIVFSYSNPTITISNISTTHIPNNATKFITIASINMATPLPVQFLYFDASLNEKQTVDLNWYTTREVNNDYFEVEKSLDGLSWTKIGEVDGNGTTYEQHNYYLEDQFPQNGYNYYRLKQIDFNGEFTYSETRSVWLQIENSFDMYPNPASNKVFLSAENISHAAFDVLDCLGKVVSCEKRIISDDQLELSTEHLSNGLYYVRFWFESKPDVQKLMIHH